MMRSWVCNSSADLVIDTPGNVVGMKSSVPSFKLGMNSLPTCVTGQTDTARIAMARTMVSVLAFNTPRMTGR